MQRVEIRVKARIDPHWADWFGDLSLTYTARGETLLAGVVRDQAELYGLLGRLRDLGLPLGSATAVELEEEGGAPE